MTRSTPPPPERTPREQCAAHGRDAVRMFDQLHLRMGHTVEEALALVGWVAYRARLTGCVPVFDAQAALDSLLKRSTG